MELLVGIGIYLVVVIITYLSHRLMKNREQIRMNECFERYSRQER